MSRSALHNIFLIALLIIFTGALGLTSGAREPRLRCKEAERQTLLQIKEELQEVHDGVLSSWGEEEGKRECCKWIGIRCDNLSGHVIKIDLSPATFDAQSYFILRGNISSSLVGLRYLQYLDLSKVDFSGNSIPSFLGNLRKLNYLNLSDTSLSGEVPLQLGNLSGLQSLDLGHNYALNTRNLKWVSHLSYLQLLDLSSINLTLANDWMHVVNNLPNLANLMLQDCNLPNVVHTSLSHVNSSKVLAFLDLSYNSDLSASIFQWLLNYGRSLVHVDLSFCGLKSSIPKSFGNNMTALTSLDLRENQLQGSIPESFGKMTGLTYLDLSYNLLKGPGLEAFGNTTALKYLNLSHIGLNGSIPESFGEMSALTYLDLSYNQLKGPIPEAFKNMTALAYLSLRQNELEGSIPNALGNINGLSYLDLGANKIGGSIPEAFGNMTSLSFLNLETNFLEGEIPKSLGSICTLQILNLKENKLRGQLPSFGRLLSRCAHYSLESLGLSENRMTGSLLDHSLVSSLKELQLSSNQLNGAVPVSIGQLTQLETLDISMNALEGVISEAHFSKLSQLRHLDLSNNKNLVLSVPSDWIPPFHLAVIRVGSCKLGSQFPNWLRTQKYFSQLDISNCGISGSIPDWFWNSSAYSYVMNLSNNQLTGKIQATYPPERGDLTSLDLSSNQFEGPIPLFSLYATASHLSDNNFSTINLLCDVAYSPLSFLDISDNQLVGELPNCWSPFQSLQILVLTNNNLSGTIPSSIGSSHLLETLNLGNNNFTGNLPSSLKNCSKLKVLDVGSNKLQGSIPTWLGKSLPNIVILSLRSNRFHGSMPSSLCHLVSLQLLDLSLNDISGSIPNCVGNFTVMKTAGIDETSTTITILYEGSEGVGYSAEATLTWKGKLSHYQSTLRLVKSIDLSSNKLIGEIPREIVELNQLVSLNLSRNHLSGQIPTEIGQLKSLDALDLSRNHFSGRIPSSLSEVDRLNTLDLSSNNFSGKIPTSTQLQSFDPATYLENPELCGPPLPKCPGEDTNTTTSANTEDAEDLEDQDSFISRGYYISMGVGFAVGFWGLCSPLLLIKSWRYAYFKLLNHAGDWIFVIVAVHKAKLWRMIKC